MQDELKKKNEPNKVIELNISVRPKYKKYDGMPDVNSVWEQTVTMETSKYVSNAKIADALKSAIQSLSDKPSEPKGYVDWNKIPKEYNWVVVQGPAWTSGGRVRMYSHKPPVCSYMPMWAGENGADVPMYAIIGPLPAWDKSLIHRPGAKE